MQLIRNIAIVAHVDHGKTTMVDQLLKQAGTFRANQATEERMMDSMDLEKEKGITIRAKNASFKWKDYHINVVDTPGHADFGGEVERIMKMIDGVLLVVDSFDGPQAQTKFVLRKAMEAGLKPIIVINKIDRPNARPHAVLDMIFELFLDLNAADEQLDFPAIYASGKEGFSCKEWKGELTEEIRNGGMASLFDAIIEHVPAPILRPVDFFSMSIANLDYNDYVGRIAYGKIHSGKVKMGDSLVCIHKDGSIEKGKVTKLYGYQGMEKVELENAEAGDIIGLAGFENAFIGETLTDNETREPLPLILIDPPTIKMQFLVNDSPMNGQEGKFLTARHIRERLVKELRTNVSLQMEETEAAGIFDVSARGEMQIAVLVEQMRREGFELMVSRPEVIIQIAPDGTKLEPIEVLYVDVPNENLGDVLQNIAGRKGEIVNMKHLTATVYVEAIIPTRGLIGLETDMKNLTKGMGLMSHIFKEYGAYRGDIPSRDKGVAIAMEQGETKTYSLESLQERTRLFVGPGEAVYGGMIVGENSRPDDMVVNPCKAKALSNMRSQGDGKGVQLEPALKLSLERALEYIAADEFVEVTPKSLRLRKRVLDHNKRKRVEQKA